MSSLVSKKIDQQDAACMFWQKNGFFVEAGAQDGERSSNTVWLELKRDYTGLLVEIDPWFYTQMRSKLRRAYTINAGLSPKPYITEVEARFKKKIVDEVEGLKWDKMYEIMEHFYTTSSN